MQTVRGWWQNVPAHRAKPTPAFLYGCGRSDSLGPIRLSYVSVADMAVIQMQDP